MVSTKNRDLWLTSGLVQRHSVFEWLCKHNRLRPEPIRFVKLDSEHAQSDGKSVNRGLPVLDLARGLRPEVHSGQTTGHSREHARDLSTSGHFPSTSHKISTVNLRPRAISVLSSIIFPLQTFFSRVLLLRQQPFSSENLPLE